MHQFIWLSWLALIVHLFPVATGYYIREHRYKTPLSSQRSDIWETTCPVKFLGSDEFISNGLNDEDWESREGFPSWLQGLSLTLWGKIGFPGVSVVKNPPVSAGDANLIPGSRRSPGGGHGNPLQYSCLKNPHGQRSLVGYTVHRISKSQTRLKQLSMHTCRFNVVYVGFSCRGHLFLSIIL